MKKLKEKIKCKVCGNEYTKKFLEYDFRTVCFSILSLAITIGFALVNGVLAFTIRSSWYAMLAVYYTLIVLMRARILLHHGVKFRQKADDEQKQISAAKIYKNCGIIVVLLTLPLSFTILFMVADKLAFTKSGYMIYASATYTFYKIGMSIKHIVRAKKSNDLTVLAIRSINLADMLVSILALQTAMFYCFSPNDDMSVYNALTGAFVCLSQVILGVVMIYRGKRKVVQIEYEINLNKINQEIN